MRWPFLRTTNEPNEDSFTVSPRSRQSVISLSTSLDECGGFGSRQPDLLVHGLAQIRPRHRLARHRQPHIGDRPRESASTIIHMRADMVNGIRFAPGRSTPVRTLAHQRTSAAPQVKPPPIASSSTRSPRLMRPSRDRDGERERDRGGGGVAVPVDGGDDLLGRDAELVRRAVDDALVGLMRHEPVDVVGACSRWPRRRPRSRR